ncbi:hypothetical protein GC177_10645 [bacterium]|nr:hypothetical protein [bacterium]
MPSQYDILMDPNVAEFAHHVWQATAHATIPYLIRRTVMMEDMSAEEYLRLAALTACKTMVDHWTDEPGCMSYLIDLVVEQGTQSRDRIMALTSETQPKNRGNLYHNQQVACQYIEILSSVGEEVKRSPELLKEVKALTKAELDFHASGVHLPR